MQGDGKIAVCMEHTSAGRKCMMRLRRNEPQTHLISIFLL